MWKYISSQAMKTVVLKLYKMQKKATPTWWKFHLTREK